MSKVIRYNANKTMDDITAIISRLDKRGYRSREVHSVRVNEDISISMIYVEDIFSGKNVGILFVEYIENLTTDEHGTKYNSLVFEIDELKANTMEAVEMMMRALKGERFCL
jgi:hypothetical protein